MTQLPTLAAVGGILALLAAAAALSAVWATRRWRQATARAVARLAGGAAARAAASPGPLPEPVRRYFDFALGQQGRPIRSARLVQTGSFALRPGAFKPFTAVQHYRLEPPGFVWDARIVLAPLLAVQVRDGYAGGRGQMKASLLGLLPLADLEGGGELAAASLQRYLAELPWLPTALLPAAGVTWTAIDSQHARATLEDGDISAEVEFEIDDRGMIERVSALRSRAVDGSMVLTPWEGRFWDYREVAEGLRLPHQAEVAWLLPEGRHVYWQARIARFELDRG